MRLDGKKTIYLAHKQDFEPRKGIAINDNFRIQIRMTLIGSIEPHYLDKIKSNLDRKVNKETL